ncbi:MAG: S41 family peptidase [Pseudomonadota bacterium]|nr:S41 family peptidase [Pseudomonadota bacterium]
MKQLFPQKAAIAGAGLALGVILGGGAQADTRENSLPLEDLQVFAEVFGKIKSDYVDEVEDSQLLQDAIQGMLAGLDPHSAFLEPDAFKDMRISTEGKFGGLGIEVTMEDGFIRVVAPIDDTPAYEAGLQPGDIITRLDDTSVQGMALDDAVKMMRGKPGSKIRLTIVREGVDNPFDVTLKRAVIKLTSIKGELLEDGYAYIRVSSFQSNTTPALRKKIASLKKKAGGRLSGLVLDLRNNPGGVLNSAVEVSDAFLSRGVIVTTRGRQGDSDLSFTATPGDLVDDAPMVVLVNAGSASASEIVAGALQDHRRAVVMGTKTFGKGSVQTILPMNNGAALKMTTARYYTPSNRSIQATGIEPDIVQENGTLVKTNEGRRLREADLSRHLSNENGGRDSKRKRKRDNGKKPLQDKDFQVREALNLLKGMSIVHAGGKRKK